MEARRLFIGTLEEGDPRGKPRVYGDADSRPLFTPHQQPFGSRTVGLGFNMDRKEAEDEWIAAFATTPKPQRPDFDRVRSGTQTLTQVQINRLFAYSADMRQVELATGIYGKTWGKMPAHIRLAIESMHYNAPSLVREGTNFYKAITGYMLDPNPQRKAAYFKRAVWELRHNSNAKSTGTSIGIQSRRIA